MNKEVIDAAAIRTGKEFEKMKAYQFSLIN